MHCESKLSARARTQRIDPGQDSNRAVFLKSPGVLQCTKTFIGLCFSVIFHPPSPLFMQLKKKKKTTISLKRCCTAAPSNIVTALYSSKGIASKAPIFEPLRLTNIHLITAVAHCAHITHLHIWVRAPWFASACQDYICNMVYQETKDRPCM